MSGLKLPSDPGPSAPVGSSTPTGTTGSAPTPDVQNFEEAMGASASKPVVKEVAQVITERGATDMGMHSNANKLSLLSAQQQPQNPGMGQNPATPNLMPNSMPGQALTQGQPLGNAQNMGQDQELSSELNKDAAALAGFNLVEAMFAGKTATPNAQAAAVTAPVAPADTSDMMDKMVERILVSDPGKGQPEVRISLNADTLPGTEVRISRALDGQLSVQLVTNNASSFQSLVASQDALKQALSQQGEDVRVEVSSEKQQGEGNDPNQRSRGFWEYENT